VSLIACFMAPDVAAGGETGQVLPAKCTQLVRQRTLCKGDQVEVAAVNVKLTFGRGSSVKVGASVQDAVELLPWWP